MSRRTNSRYTLFNFIFDVILICITGGLWLLWILIREIRGFRK